MRRQRMAGALRIRGSTTSHRPRKHGAACSCCTGKLWPEQHQIRISFTSSGVLAQRSRKRNSPEFFTSDAASRNPVIAAR